MATTTMTLSLKCSNDACPNQQIYTDVITVVNNRWKSSTWWCYVCGCQLWSWMQGTEPPSNEDVVSE